MHSFLHFLFFTLLWALTWLPISAHAQTPVRSDSLVMRDLQANGIAIDSGNDVVLLSSGHEKFEDLFRCLKQARSFIHMEYFNFRNDSINNLLIHLLHRKVQEGVEVRVMYDAFGNSSNNRPIKRAEHDSISALGIRIVKFDPIRFPWLNHIIPRDHRKIVVVDGQTAYTGGMNVADYYINGIEGIGPWRDMHLRIHGPAVNRLHRIFTTMWAKATGEVLDGPHYFPAPQFQSAQRRLAIVDRAPRVSNRSIRQLYVSMLNHATRHVRIINPYFVPTHQVRQAIKNAIARGVDVEILLSEKSDIPLTPDASHYVGYKLSKRGADVQLFQGGFHHTKLMIVDDTFCTIGSSNLDSRSLRCDYEVNVVIFDEEIVARLNAMFDRDLQSSVPLTRQYWRSKTLWKRLVGWFGNLLTPVL
jgi:cardiolipin synthase